MKKAFERLLSQLLDAPGIDLFVKVGALTLSQEAKIRVKGQGLGLQHLLLMVLSRLVLTPIHSKVW